MTKALSVILDDRDPPAESVRAALGEVRFSDIMRRRQTLAKELTAMSLEAGAETVEHLMSPESGVELADRIRDRGDAAIYLRVPLCLPPLDPEGFSVLVRKAGYALKTMLASPVINDEAVAVLFHAEAASLLCAETPEARRLLLLSLRDRTEIITDHARFIDIREPRNLMLFLSGATELRHFNSARSEDNVFHKQSTDIAKMRAEHGFFHAAPPELQRFLLPTFGFWEDGKKAGYQMEHLAIPDAALQWVHHSFTEGDFKVLLDQIFNYLNARTPGKKDRARAETQILEKLDKRLAGFLETERGRQTNQILEKAGPRGGLPDMLEQARPFIRKAVGTTDQLVFSHGDPCFSNVLFDRRIGLMRLIDPRGALSADDAMMHPLYDVAKISHSILGCYDYVNNGLFRVYLNKELRLELDWAIAPPADWAERHFCDRLEAEGFDIAHVRAVELSLFLSMLPLHTDHPDKLVGFALIAASILDQLESGQKRQRKAS
ncbi:hypothetical protein FIV06_03255 [Labrenzia sp. THAF191b]|uniref:hypothetical protein n=1 Tax=unclassified Labrenzia TaxID=2648686 RepID=UPI001268CFC4|nr:MULTISPECIES: hypothetical protein [unclassified Labrenzia]QFS96422.1 hypothetical protein FIV06_03255 [Labrenzia sp. THAF191b]QFT02737.1 hypothetical protein FIV05_03255 [Labrenzia sp. THAF191a]QFT14279.1 hypothetical protein FIV03_03260 [Labrenzia sp. THAF187b]